MTDTQPTRTRRTPEQLAAYHQQKADAAKARIADKAAREAAKAAEAELARKRKVLAGLSWVELATVEDALSAYQPKYNGVALAGIVAALRGEATDE